MAGGWGEQQTEREEEQERERVLGDGSCRTRGLGHLAPPVVYASLAAVVTSVPLTILRIEHRVPVCPFANARPRLRSITYPVCIAVAAPQRRDRRWIFERPRIILLNLRLECKNVCYINDTLGSSVVCRLVRVSDAKLSDETLPVCVRMTAVAHLNFQDSTENANAFVYFDPAFIGLKVSLVQKTVLSIVIEERWNLLIERHPPCDA